MIGGDENEIRGDSGDPGGVIGVARDYFCCFNSYLHKIARLTNEEAGQLWRALMRYNDTGEQPDLSPALMMAFDFIATDIDKTRAAYEAKCRQNAENRSKREKTDVYEREEDATTVNERERPCPKTKTKTKTKTKSNSPNGESSAPEAGARKSFGVYGWVKLTDSDYNRLLNDLGEAEVKRCIEYVDEQAQSTGNKNGWRDWYLTVRRCHRDGWGLDTKKPPKSMQPGTDTNPTPERIKANADWLDEFLAEQEAGE